MNLEVNTISAIRPIQLLIAGAGKAGTTSLLRYLGQHPGICTHNQIEMSYFVHDHEYAQGYMGAFNRYFSCNEIERQVVLAKCVTIMYLPQAMKRLFNHNPNIQLVVSLRHPVERACSDYWYARRMGWETLKTFEEAIEADPKRFSHDWIRQRGCAYLDKSLYVKHLSSLFEHFGREQVHVVFFEDLKHDPIRICKMLFGLFDELDDTFVPNVKKHFNPAAIPRSKRLALLTSTNLGFSIIRRALRRLLPDHMVDGFRDMVQRLNEKKFIPEPMKFETRIHLINYFKPFNDKLSELLGKNLSHWNEL